VDFDDILDQLADKIAAKLVDFRPPAKAVETTRLLNTQELASRFGVHEHTVRRWVAKGCPHEALPGEATRFRFQLSAVSEWLKSRRAA
jgi:excisionase family DNA binding protein